MTREELIAQCRYYKGETENPFKEPPSALFWEFENQYIEANFSNDKETGVRDNYIKSAKRYIQENSNVQNILTSSDISIESKAIILFCEDMLQKWMPYDVGLIFHY